MTGLPLLALGWLLGRRKGGAAAASPWPVWTAPGAAPAAAPAGAATAAQPAPTPRLQPLPGRGWKPYAPPPSAVVGRAVALLGTLDMGHYVQEPDPTRPSSHIVAYRKEPRGGGKVGVTAYVKAVEAQESDLDQGRARG